MKKLSDRLVAFLKRDEQPDDSPLVSAGGKLYTQFDAITIEATKGWEYGVWVVFFWKGQETVRSLVSGADVPSIAEGKQTLNFNDMEGRIRIRAV
jgi:hypothetical protein